MCCDMVLVMLLPVLLINLTFSMSCKYDISFQYVLRHGVSYVSPGAPNQPYVFNILSI